MDDLDLPPAVREYFRLMDGDDKARVASLFTADAVVHDDGQTCTGREAVLRWLTGPVSAFTTTSTLLSAVRAGHTTSVTVLLEGDFPGGRVELHHAFALDAQGAVTALSITPLSSPA